MTDESDVAVSAQSAASAPAIRVPHIGAFVLETLTLGMYGEPRHTLREYVQNSFDSIRAARRLRILDGVGRVDITVQPDEITIRDNGAGVSASQAWATLTSVGASKKDRQRDAGFRGIGRLAGMAYCDALIFKTSFIRESTLTTITFDCASLLKEMNPDEGGGMELAKLLGRATTFSQTEDAAVDDHFFEVTLRGLSQAPESLRDADQIRDYLSTTVPVDFAPDWDYAKRIREAYQNHAQSGMENIELYVTCPPNTIPIPVYKPYGDVYQLFRGTSTLRDLQFIIGSENRYWAWIGKLTESAAITDDQTRALRIRVRNIQVDGTEIVESLFGDVKQSFGRISSYYIGEIHIDPEHIVPNARRDGFEETETWRAIKEDIRETICRPLANEAYERSRRKQLDVATLINDITEVVKDGDDLVQSTTATYDQVVGLVTRARRLKQRSKSSLKIINDLDDTATDEEGAQAAKAEALTTATKDLEIAEQQARLLIGKTTENDARIMSLKARLRDEVLAELLDIVKEYVDPTTYQQVRKHLHSDSA